MVTLIIMYFTDKFPRAELKLLHPGLVKHSPGRRPPVIHKNATSTDFQFLSKVYSNMAFSRYTNLSQHPPSSETLQQIFDLQQTIREKDQKIKEFQYKIQNSRSTGAFNRSKQDFSEYLEGLKGQIRENEMKKVEERVKKNEDIVKRLKEEERIFYDEEKNRGKELERASNYKGILETQKNLKKSLEFSQATKFPGLKTQRKVFVDQKLELFEVPERLNNNELTIRLSTLPEFSQTNYTKKHPKVVKRNPITGE